MCKMLAQLSWLEHLTVNQRVLGSSPRASAICVSVETGRQASFRPMCRKAYGFESLLTYKIVYQLSWLQYLLVTQGVVGSSPIYTVKKNIAYALVYSKIIQYICNEIASIVQLVEQLICNQQVVGSSPTGGSNISQIGAVVARQAHNLEVGVSITSSATNIHQVFTSGSLVRQRLRINPVMGINVHQMRYGCVQKEEIPFHRKIPQSRLLWQLQANTVKSEEQLKY